MLKKHEFTVDYYKTKSIGIFSTSFARKYKKFRLPLVLKTFDIFLSIIMDIFNYGDSIEIYARKIN